MYKKQQGLTMFSWMVVIAFLGVVLVSAINIIPSYLNYMSAKGILDDLANSTEVKGKSAVEVKILIIKRFNFNNLRHIDTKKALKFKNKGASDRAGYTVQLAYEDRGKIIGNLYFVTVFDYSVEIIP